MPSIHKMKEGNPLWVALLDVVLTFGMSYFILQKVQGKVRFKEAAFAGALINLISSGAWSFANAALFINWSVTLIIVDISWHVALGISGGVLIAKTYNRFQKNFTPQFV